MAEHAASTKRAQTDPRAIPQLAPSEPTASFPAAEDIEFLVQGCEVFGQCFPDEFERFMSALGLCGERARELEGQAVAPVLAIRFREIQPAESVEELRASEPLAWLYSIAAWVAFEVEGERAARGPLAVLLFVHRAFFLRQRWIAELLDQWHERRDFKKERAVLFYTPKRGQPTLEGALEAWDSNKRLCGAVYKRVQSGMSQTKAIQEVAKQSLALLGRTLSQEGVRSTYEKYMRRDADPALVKILSVPE